MTESLDSFVILVDQQNQSIGTMDKLSAHLQGKLHRAYSVLVFRKISDCVELLLQQRSPLKYHGGGLWTNTCCSHPIQDNELISNATERLYEEMGIRIPLVEAGIFQYFAQLDNKMFEHEMDHVLIGNWVEQEIHPNAAEVVDYCWMAISTLQQKLAKKPETFTPWLSQALELALSSKEFINLMSIKEA